MRTHRRFLVFGLGLWLAGSALPARAAAPALLRDLYDSGVDTVHGGQVRGTFLSLGRVALVPATEPGSGTEVWVTDGTDAGTRPLLDACPGPCSTGVDLLGALGKVGIFLLSPELSESQLWRSDGTPLGTFALTPSSQGGPKRCAISEPARAAVAGSTLFFSGLTEGGCELWKTDGTAAGTRRLREITPPELGAHVLHELTAVGGRVFFVAQDFDGWGLWRSDGTPGGTVRLHSWRSYERPQPLVAAGSRLFFVAESQGLEVWASDGTPAGTRALTSFAPADPGLLLQQAEGRLYFVANDGTNGREMWVSDGTASGTRLVTRFAIANPFSGAWKVEKLGGRLIFPANDGLNGLRFWTSDGRPESTAPLDRCSGSCPSLPPDLEMVRVGAKIFFPVASVPGCLPDGPVATDLWVSDGTGAGTRRVHDFCPCCQVARLSALLGKAFFVAGNFIDYGLWASDGTDRGTHRLVPLESSSAPLPVPPVAMNGRALFAAVPFDEEVPDLWVTDGTPAGTEAIAFIGRNGWSSSPHDLVPTPEGARFLAYDEQVLHVWDSRGTAATTVPLDVELLPDHLEPFGNLTLGWGSDGLWRTDGTPAGSFRLTPEGIGHVSGFAVLGSRVFFLLNEAGAPTLWTTDGTLAGTHPFGLPGAGLPRPAGTSALIEMHPRRLWLTDGTLAGTREILMPDEYEGITGSQAAQLGTAIFFQAYTRLRGDEFWRTDGTAAGTHPFAEEKLRSPIDLIAHRGALYFTARSRDGSTPGLWRSDGTEAGTVLQQSFSEAAIAGFTPLGDLLFFRAVDAEHGTEPWRTDGTPAGTVPVRDIAAGEASSSPAELTVLGGKLYFAAHEEEHGIELWESDGTAAGTRLVQDITPGAFSSAPQELTAGGDGRLYFTADDGIHGREPWVYAPEGAACVPSDTVLCLGGGRFKVEADWRVERDSGRGHPVSLTADTGYFWFFDAANVEVIVKVLDGQGINGHHWVFYGALSNVEYSLTVTDTQTGAARRYTNVPGRLGSVADTQAFGPLGASAPGVVTVGAAPVMGEALIAARTAAATGSCTPGATRLCLQDGRFAVEARWKAQGQTGTGKAVPLAGGDTGYFWFFDASNVEVVLKVLDGRPLNGKFWVFYGALSNVEYTLTVTDTVTGTVKTYTNPGGRLASVADTEAF